jgi:microcompartment protein CcmL/EutN
METKKKNKFFIGTVISLFVLVFCIGGAVADIDTALEGAKKIGEKAEQVQQMKKAFSTPEEEVKTQVGEQQEETTAEKSANETAEEVIKEKATEALQENIMKKTIGD